jgi:uncharacterized protein (DUF58 family)
MADRRVPASEIFDPEFLESLKALRFVARRVAAGGRFAEQRSKDLGSGLEFRDYRPYAPGDDFRSIDWNIYRRLGRIFLRLFEELEDLPLYLLPDISDSCFLEEPPRARAGLRSALALAAISLNQHDRVGIFPFAGDLHVEVRPRAGKRRIFEFADHLARLEPSGPTDFEQSMRRFSSLRLRRGLVVVISDFFDPGGVQAVTDALATLRHDLLLVQLARRSDSEPDVSGDVRLLDCETGEGRDVSITPAVLSAYRDAYVQFEQGLTSFAQGRPAGLVRLDVERPVVPQLAHLFEAGHYAV